MRADTQCMQDEGVWRLAVRIGLEPEEASRLFLLGDILLSWPTDGLLVPSTGTPVARGFMYLSEVQSRRGGLLLEFGTETQARRALAVITAQLENAARRLAARGRSMEEKAPEAPDDMSAGDGVAVVQEDSMQDLIAEYTQMPGVIAALLISDQGLVVACVERKKVDSETIAALVVDTLSAARRFGVAAGVGALDTMSLEYENVGLFLAPFTEDVILALVKEPHPPGRVVASTSPV